MVTSSGLRLAVVLLVFAMACGYSPRSGSGPSATGQPRDVSLFGSIFQWFEASVENFLNYISGSPGKPSESSSRVRKTNNPRITYRNYQLVRIRPNTDQALYDVQALGDEDGVEFWTTPMKNRSTDVIIPPDMTQYVRDYFAERDIEFTILSHNLEVDIKKQNPKLSKHQRAELKSSRGHTMTWNRYHRYDDIQGYMEHLMSSAPHMVDVLTIGKSSEGRPLKVVKVSTGKEMGKPAIWIDGGMHGREWIAPAVALYILKQLVENQLNSNISIIQKLDWYIMPVVNPDGYEYTHVTDRFWRKSRSKTQDAEFEENRMFWDSARECAGVDLNRNWDFHWGEVGSSDNPCSPNYSGLRPFSEPETRAVSDFILDKRDQLKAYITLHSYSQMWLIPWGFTKQKVADYEDLLYLGKKAIESLSKVHGTKYTIGTSPALLYPTSGSSDDWAKGKAGIQYSYTVELRDRGTYGFLLPATQIVPTGRETFAGVRTLAKSLINNRELKKSHQGRRRPRIGVQWQQLSDS